MLLGDPMIALRQIVQRVQQLPHRVAVVQLDVVGNGHRHRCVVQDHAHVGADERVSYVLGRLRRDGDYPH